jgi:hypothetical protein
VLRLSIPLPPGGTLQVTHFGETEGFPWNVVHHFRCTPATAPAQVDLDDVVEGVRSAYAANFLAYISSELVYEGARGKFWTSGGDLYEGEALNPVIAPGDSKPLPLNCAVVISWRVHRIWRGGKPRTYLPGLEDSAVDDGRRIDADKVTSIQSNARAYLTAVNAVGHGALSIESMTALRRFAAGGSEAHPKVYLDPPEHVDIVGAICRSVIGSQRRRLHRL